MIRKLTFLALLLSSLALLADNPTAKIEKVWLEHGVMIGNVKNMAVHTKFFVYNFLGRTGSVGAFIMDKNGSWHNVRSEVSTKTGVSYFRSTYKPGYDNSVYNDFTINIPVDDMRLYKGSNSYTVVIAVYDDNGNILAQDNSATFTGTSQNGPLPPPTVVAQEKPSAKINSLKIDYTQTPGQQDAIKLHLDFNAMNFGKKTGSVVFRLYKNNSSMQWIANCNGGYLTKSFTPNYENSHYSDFDASIPVSDLRLESISSTYYITAQIYSPDGSLLTTSDKTQLPLISRPEASISGISITDNISRDNQKGIIITIHFTARNTQHRPLLISAFFEDQYGNAFYGPMGNEVSSSTSFTPSSAIQSGSCDIFIPYSDFGLKRSTKNIVAVGVRIIDDSNNTLATSYGPDVTIPPTHSTSTKKSAPTASKSKSAKKQQSDSRRKGH